MIPPPWDPMYEAEDRTIVPDRTGQTWIIERPGYSMYLIIGSPELAAYNNNCDDKRWLHPTIDLMSGSPQSITEWTFESWSTRDSGSWKRIT